MEVRTDRTQMFVTPSHVVKRDGKRQELDTFRIFHAIRKARDETEGSELTDRGIWELIPHVLVEASQVTPEAEPIPVETIQDSVEKCLVQHGFFRESRAYIRYRYKRELARKNTDSIFETIAEIVDGVNEEALQENANKNPLELATQRDYIAGTLSRVYADNFILPKRCKEAHQSGRTHFHDSDYAIQRSHNCELIDLQDIFANGTVINKTKIETPHTFLTACTIASQIDACVASASFGGQTISVAHLVPFVEKSRQRYREEVREELLGTDWHFEVSHDELEKEVNRIAERRVQREINAGVQTIHYQLNSIATSNGLRKLAVVKQCERMTKRCAA